MGTMGTITNIILRQNGKVIAYAPSGSLTITMGRIYDVSTKDNPNQKMQDPSSWSIFCSSIRFLVPVEHFELLQASISFTRDNSYYRGEFIQSGITLKFPQEFESNGSLSKMSPLEQEDYLKVVKEFIEK
jgi:hypothetical protein